MLSPELQATLQRAVDDVPRLERVVGGRRQDLVAVRTERDGPQFGRVAGELRNLRLVCVGEVPDAGGFVGGA